MNLLGCFFALLLGILFIGLAFIGNVINVILSILGFKKRIDPTAGFGQQSGGAQQRSYGSSQQSGNSQQQSQQASHTGQQTHKIFEKDDSEYVDFEEV